MTESAAGEALFEVVGLTLQTFFRLRAAGTRFGAVTPGGGGLWGLLNTLKTEGPRTVPQIARSRPVSRQHIQTLADDMAADGLVEFIANPAHKRSKLVRLTPRGEAVHADLTARMGELCDRFAQDMDEAELRTAARVLATLRQKLSEV